MLNNSKIKLDEIHKTYTNTKSIAKQHEDECFVIRNEKKDLKMKLNNVLKENDEMKKTIAHVKDNIKLINEKEEEVSVLKSQIDTMRKEALVSTRHRHHTDRLLQ